MFEEIKERFEFILESISLIETRFNKIRFPDDLIDSEDGMTILDSIAMRLQAIGDNIKSIFKLDPNFLSKYPETDWIRIMKMRDIISHHYEGLDHEIIFSICKDKLNDLKSSIIEILNSLNAP
ncbi:PF01934 family protein [Leptospira noguchii serovar Autumnalis str. ZUN142]|uniref:PF01934 family protein n=1 Tax=Leptospira noguchii serovar Autumnalis str. ZUN142 TaxID=1085540 RepID=M6U441_9LEPT|nr:HepT-like ribonuclease domain-containing protein [Leptospira noguchii]EMO39812.1 PF01934 family protein [Leptospira noguchii serovar Autumnalis str. ZUN142]